MKRHLSAIDKIDSIRLELRHPKAKNNIWILVEGIDDVKIFRKLIGAENTKIEQVHGGIEQLRKAVGVLSKESKQVLGIRDADFLHLNNKTETIENLFLTDYHDIEMMMISTEHVILSLSNEFFTKEENVSIKSEDILNSIKYLSYIRWFNYIHVCKFNFNGLSFDNFYDPANYILDKKLCINKINERSSNKTKTLNKEEIDSFIDDNLSVDLYQLCNGHDIINVLQIIINKISGEGVKIKEISRVIRAAYLLKDFKKTLLYQHLKGWENHSGLILFQK